MGEKLRNGVARLDRLAPRLPLPFRSLVEIFTHALRKSFGSVTSARQPTSYVGLTFDDGPDPAETGRILDLLAERGTKASFFLLSERAEERPDLAKRLVDEGHETCLHGANHDNLTRLGVADVVDRVRGGKHRLQHTIGIPIKLFRPPYGAQNLRSFLVVRVFGMTPIMWSAWGDDWEERSAEEIAERSMRNLEGGGILLLHDGYEPNPDHPTPRPTYDRVAMVTQVLDKLDQRGLTPTTVSDLLDRAGVARSVWFES